MAYKTIIEPFKIKSVEPLRIGTREERAAALERARYNLFGLHAHEVLIDLLTDSGTAAMSSDQWAEIMRGDESYAGSESFYRLESVVRDLTGFRFVIPTHQGRAAERILFSFAVKRGQAVANNTHFDTTRANIEYVGGEAVDLVIPEGKVPSLIHPFKGNMDLAALAEFVRTRGRENIAAIMVTVTNNSGGGQPVALGNIRGISRIARENRIPFILDACRFAENSYFVKLREEGQGNRSARDIAQEMFRLADGCTFSAKKDGLANIGGFLALNDEGWAEQARNLLILTEGFPTYGGLAGRDLGAIAQGLVEVLDEDYLTYRLASVRYLGEHLSREGVPMILPPGGHAVYLDAKAFLPHVPPSEYPGQALACALYTEGGIRGVEIGSVMFGRRDPQTGRETPATLELVRLAVPRRVYTQSHVDYVVEVILEVFRRRHEIRGMEIVRQAPYLRHFTAEFRPKTT